MNIQILEDTEIRYVKALVESESKEGSFYIVEYQRPGQWKCTCIAGQHDKMCKHVKEVIEETKVTTYT